ncbi:MAG: class I SAM-dependent methyltransferase, partial [Calditrichaeota bacterium]|nr:class I SAM-dependent methyltransferase [Calditrichota bacterium]
MNSKQYFNQVAGDWDQMREHFYSEKVRETALAIAEVRPGMIAADIGAGTGFITEGLLQKGLKVIAVDQSEAMTEVLKKKFATADCRVGEAENLPIKDGAVDFVFANMYLHHVDKPSAAIKEMVRVLKPGGMVIITDLDEHDFEFLSMEQNDRWLGFKREDIARWFEEAGLTDIRIDCTDEECCSESNCGCESANISIFVASG